MNSSPPRWLRFSPSWTGRQTSTQSSLSPTTLTGVWYCEVPGPWDYCEVPGPRVYCEVHWTIGPSGPWVYCEVPGTLDHGTLVLWVYCEEPAPWFVQAAVPVGPPPSTLVQQYQGVHPAPWFIQAPVPGVSGPPVSGPDRDANPSVNAEQLTDISSRTPSQVSGGARKP
ncbi:unnamed protein product [Arctogadus glacialis]